VWTPTPSQALWGAVSRAVRTPSRAELDAQLDLSASPANSAHNPMPFAMLIRNVPRDDHQLAAEKVTALELGYRRQFEPGMSLDVTAFHNRYTGLRSSALGMAEISFSPRPYLVQSVVPNNNVEARTHGLELSLDWRVAPWWRLQPSYSYLRVTADATTDDPIDRMNALAFERGAPKHQISLRSSMSFSDQRQLDLWLRHVSALGDADMAGSGVPAYTTLDVRYAWRPMKGLELSIVGQNLLDRRHPEFVPVLLPSETLQVERGVYIKAKWQF
jgi:iron complex outermembrane recepter protein